ncbi:tellurium resistance protein TerC, partial [Pseudomonas syringae pv. actinidiae]|nr:tellurium resistance protein TerC [Pseudomonas syringae pv. actinidiae]
MESTSLGFPPLTMAVFVGLAITAMAIDMFSHRGNKPITLAQASAWSIFWVAISLAFAGFLYVQHGSEVATLFVTGYALE